MSFIKAAYQDMAHCCDEFKRGLVFLEQGRFGESIKCFSRACGSVLPSDQFYQKYKSYYGFSLLLNGDVAALQVCRDAMKSSPGDGDICMNLARAEVVLGNRLAAINAIEAGMALSEGHEGLLALQQKIGVREKKPLPILARDNPLNVALGKRMRREYR